MNPAFIGPLKHAGLSLSIGLAACLNASLLYWQLRKQKIFTPQPGWTGSGASGDFCAGDVCGAAGDAVHYAGVVSGDNAVASAALNGGGGGWYYRVLCRAGRIGL